MQNNKPRKRVRKPDTNPQNPRNIHHNDAKKEKFKKFLILLLIFFCFIAGIMLLLWILGMFNSEIPEINDTQIRKDDVVDAPEINSRIPDNDAEIDITEFRKQERDNADANETNNDKHPYAKPNKSLGTFEYVGYGANQCVSGSMHKIKIDGETLMLDAGSFYGFDFKNQARLTPEVYKDVPAVLISHAHLDHTGRMLELVKNGFSGKFYCSPPTKEILPVMLHMMAKTANLGTEKFFYSTYWHEKNTKKDDNTEVHLFEDCQDVKKIKAGERGYITTSRNKLAELGFYLCKDCAWRIVEKTMKQVVAMPIHKPFKPTPNLEVTYYNTPHMPGSVMGLIKSLKSNHSLIWTGDYGSGTSPFLLPQEYPKVDPTWAIIEGTYSPTVKSTSKKDRDELVKYIGKCLAENKRVIIPAFVLDRSQQVLAELTKGIRKGYIKQRDESMIKIFSPTIAKINKIYSRIFTKPEFKDYFSDDFMKNGPFDPDIFVSGYNVDEVGYGEIAIASSGMADFNFSYDMVKKWIGDPNTVFILVSYQAPTSVGGRIYKAKQRGDKTIVFEDKTYDIHAEIIRKGSFSGHGKVDQISDFLGRYNSLQNVLIVHSDEDNIKELAVAYRKLLPQNKFDMPEGGKKYIYKSSKNVPDVVKHGKVGKNNGADKSDDDASDDPEFPVLKLITLDKSKLKIIAGDFMYYNDQMLELNNVDTPVLPSKKLKEGASQEPYASQAFNLVKNMVKNAKVVQAIRIKHVSYDKYQIYLICDGKNVNAELLRNSLGFLKPAAEKYGAQGCDKYWNEIMEANKVCKPKFENPYFWYKKNKK
ncbi:MAG: thermonuclease family protein [Planctomycetes bacterium]|nr:thermonuclease family protein [Planctomycetota bacterium]